MKINVSMERGKQVETCLVIVTGLILFWFIFDKKILLTIALVVGIIGAFIPFLAKWIHWAWYKLAEVMGYVMSRILLSLVFFLFLFPISIIYKLFNKDTLQLKKRDDSYWTKRDHKYSGDDLKNVW